VLCLGWQSNVLSCIWINLVGGCYLSRETLDFRFAHYGSLKVYPSQIVNRITSNLGEALCLHWSRSWEVQNLRLWAYVYLDLLCPGEKEANIGLVSSVHGYCLSDFQSSPKIALGNSGDWKSHPLPFVSSLTRFLGIDKAN
jgi:hypothetical protein